MLVVTATAAFAVAASAQAPLRVLPSSGAGQARLSVDCDVPRRCVRGAPTVNRQGHQSAESSGDGPGPELSFLLSAVVPGSGQYAQGQRRWLAYVAAEIAGWFLVLDRRRDGNRLRDRYREIAWTVAREGHSEVPRTDGDFHYYETLAQWDRSGRYDTDSGEEGIQPETDAMTYNGSIWVLATGIYFPADVPEPVPGDPIYEQAMDYYVDRAYSDRFLWDWSDGPEDWARYDDTISRSDDRFREATLFTGLIAANHLLSAVDAFVSARLGDATDGALDVSTHLLPELSGERLGTRLDVSLTLRPGAR